MGGSGATQRYSSTVSMAECGQNRRTAVAVEHIIHNNTFIYWFAISSLPFERKLNRWIYGIVWSETSQRWIDTGSARARDVNERMQWLLKKKMWEIQQFHTAQGNGKSKKLHMVPPFAQIEIWTLFICPSMTPKILVCALRVWALPCPHVPYTREHIWISFRHIFIYIIETNTRLSLLTIFLFGSFDENKKWESCKETSHILSKNDERWKP